jgi:prepilin-type N-terminal cleavage/methylation domain-containing protein
MTQRRSERGRRPAFTLIELLVVIAIIAILISLTAAAVVQLLSKGPDLQTKSEESEIDQKLSGLETLPGHEVTYLPSQLILHKLNKYDPTNPIEVDTQAFLQRRFGRDTCCNFTVLPSAKYLTVPFIDWNGSGTSADEKIVLKGEQVLVFLLGGVPTYANGIVGMTGFSEHSVNPAETGGVRQGPYFEFQNARLRLTKSKPPYSAANANLGNGTGDFPMYLDPWKVGSPTNPWGAGMPYVFLASKNPNGGGLYNPYAGLPTNSPDSLLGVAPYYTSITNNVVQYVNPGTWQIISAGYDGKFGPGGLWNPRAPVVPMPGQDDQANFSPYKLSIPKN